MMAALGHHTSVMDFMKKSSVPQPEKQHLQKTASSMPAAQHTESLLSSVTREDILKAEVLWFLKLIDSHWSFTSCGNICK